MPSLHVPHESELEYDYIICGGGTSGCVIAARLAEAFPNNGPSILIIEAGPDSQGLQNVTMVGGLFQAMGGELDWDFKTVPQKHMNDRVLTLARGRFLGGSSGFNGTLCIRGSKADYDEWDLDDFSGDVMFECMRKAETFHGKDWFNAAGGHGHDGPLQTEPHDAAPISELILESMQEKGLERKDDVFTAGESGNACGHVVRSVTNGTRSFATNYLHGHEDRIDIIVRTVVDKVVLEEQDSALVATGVVITTLGGQSATVKARREVIISAGAYCSPTILLRSGIGSSSDLSVHNIACQVNLPGVGQNFQDHLVTFVPYEITTPSLTNDAKLHHPGGLEASIAQYTANQSGVFASFPFGVFAYARLDDRLQTNPTWKDMSSTTTGRDATGLLPIQPHIELMHTELYSGHIHGHHSLLAPPGPSGSPRHAFEMMTLLFAQQSRGSVSLRSADPLAPPVIDPHFLEHPLDVVVLAEGCKYAHELVRDSTGMRDHLKVGFLPVLGEGRFEGLWDGDVQTGKEGWEEYVREYSATAHHPVGTCRMGKVGHETGEGDLRKAMAEGVVVDERLRVLGVKGLRVADCSVVPKLNGGHTQMVAYAIGERAAEILVEDFRRQT